MGRKESFVILSVCNTFISNNDLFVPLHFTKIKVTELGISYIYISKQQQQPKKKLEQIVESNN